MLINLESIPSDGIKIESCETVDVLTVDEKDINFKDNISISITVNLASSTLLVKGRLEAFVRLACARCLQEIDLKIVNNKFNFCKDVKGLKVVDIITEIREGVVIMLPVKPLCNIECKGLCPKCGQDLNKKECVCDKTVSDIRWRELNNLKLKGK